MKLCLVIWKIRNKSGFTLVETLVVVTIFCIIGAGIASTFMSGMKIWSRAKNAGSYRYDVILCLEVIARELRQSIDTPHIDFEGDAAKFSFPSLVGNSVLKITYKFDSAQKALVRQQMDLEEAISEDLQPEYLEKNVASLENFSVSYLYFDKVESAYVWIDAWEKEKGVFQAIKLRCEVKGEEFTKTIFIPIS